MKKLATAILATAVLAVPARAQTSLSQMQYFSPAETVLYNPFVVSVGGTFVLETFGVNLIDPYIRLYDDACFVGSCLGSELAFDDDGGTPSGTWSNSLISIFLGPGTYTLAASVYNFTEGEARAGVAGFNDLSTSCDDDADWSDCTYELRLDSEEGVASFVSAPEPGSIVLLATGLFGVMGVARRRGDDRG